MYAYIRRAHIAELYKWPLILLKVQQGLTVFLSVVISLVILFSRDNDRTPFLLAAIFLMGLDFIWMSFAQRKLLEAKQSGWIHSVIISSGCVFTLLFPLGIMSLVQLFNEDKKEKFKSLGASVEIEPFADRPDESVSTTAIVIICFGLLSGMTAIKYFMSHPGSTDVGSFKVDTNLSTPRLYEMGRACNSNGDMACAIAVFKRLIELNPTDMTAIANLGMAQSNVGQHKSAVATFERYFGHGGNAYDVMAYYATSLNALNEKDQALDWYARALKENPHLVDVAESVVAILIDQGRTNDASLFIKKFVKQNPSASKYFGAIRERLGKKPLAASSAI